MKFVKLRKGKMQYALLGFIFVITVALFSVCTIFVTAANTYSEKYYKGDSTPDLNIITGNSIAEEEILRVLSSRESDVYNINETDMLAISNKLKFNGTNLELSYAYMIDIKDRENINWKMEIYEGDTENLAPRVGEVWIPKILADNKNISIGDKLDIKNKDGEVYSEKVTAIITDSNQPSSSMGITMIYSGDFNKFDNLHKLKYITLNTSLDVNNLNEEINDSLDVPIGGFILSKDLYILSSKTIPISVGGVGFISSILLIIILISVLKANLWGGILREYKSIGIYKAIGMKYKDIKKLYIESYGLISIISSIIGVIISIPISKKVCNITFKDLGEYKFDSTSLIILIIIFILFNLIVYLNLELTLRKIKNIKPLDAINIGVTSTKEKYTKSLIKDTANPFYMAINDIFKFKKKNILIIVMFSIAFFISTTFINLFNSAVNMSEHEDALFGVPKSNITISASTNEKNSLKDAINDLKNNKYVDKIYYWNVYDGDMKVALDYDKYNIEGGVVMKMAFNEFNDEDYTIVDGHNPQNQNEIALNTKIMEDNNLQIGDYFSMIVNGEEKDFLITGTYHSLMSSSMNLRIRNDAIDSEGGNVAFIKLKDKADYNKLKDYLEENYKDIQVGKGYKFLEDVLKDVETIAPVITLTLLIGILIFSAVNIVNIVTGINIDNKKNYGIMKALGVKNSDIVKRCVYRILILTVTGAMLGTTLTMLLGEKLFTLMLQGINVYEFNFAYTVGVIVVNILVVMVTSLICCRNIKKVSTVELIVE